MAKRDVIREMIVRIMGDDSHLNKVLHRAARMVQSVASRMNQIGEKLSSNVTAPITRFVTQGLQELTGGHHHLSNAMKILSMQIARDLLPFLNQLARVIYYLITVWASLSAEQKKHAFMVGGVIAVVGPLLKLLGFGLTILSLFITFLATGFVSWMLWVGAIALIVGGFALLIDGILQFFGVANLGIIDTVNKFRIGGVQIETWLQIAFLKGLGWFEFFKSQMLIGWEFLKFKVKESLMSMTIDLFREILVWSGVFSKWLPATAKLIHGALEGAFKTLIVNQPLAQMGNKNDLIKNIAGIEGGYQKALANTEKAISELKADDLKTAGSVKGPLDKVKSLIADTGIGKLISGFQDGLSKIRLPELPNLGQTEITPSQKKDTQFQQISLRRFGLEGPGGLARPAPKQEVSAKGVETRLDKVIDLIRSKETVAVFG